MSIVNSSNIGGLIQRTLNHVDTRLVDHGKRVAYLTAKMLEVEGTRSPKERRDICYLALLHDVGAYKTEEISRLLQFETQNVWGHSIYGYLFMHHLSPIRALAPAILYHHSPWEDIADANLPCKDLAQIISLADRVDVLTGAESRCGVHLYGYLKGARGVKFSDEVVDLFLETDRHWDLRETIRGPLEFSDFEPEADMSAEEIDAYLEMLIYAIDFRSQHTVTHTLTTTGISDELARRAGLSGEDLLHVHYGAMLHDLGKIGIPVEILEFPGKLSAQAMDIMRTHVDLTEEILAGTIDDATTRIALRHHEKLDGSGYPRGLRGEELTKAERIVAVADIASALLGARSYKEAFPKQRALTILRQDAAAGLVDADVVRLLEESFDDLIACLKEQYAPILSLYHGMSDEYHQLHQKYVHTELKQE